MFYENDESSEKIKEMYFFSVADKSIYLGKQYMKPHDKWTCLESVN